jgi:hypothetical protein
MATESVPHAALEQEIKELAETIRARHETSSEKGREAVKSVMEERIYGSPLPPKQMPSVTDPNAARGTKTLPGYAAQFPPEVKMRAEELIDLAWHKGISAAVKKVKKTDALTMDLFHDAITEKLYAEFKKRKILP